MTKTAKKKRDAFISLYWDAFYDGRNFGEKILLGVPESVLDKKWLDRRMEVINKAIKKLGDKD